jgi:hypothetical protein
MMRQLCALAGLLVLLLIGTGAVLAQTGGGYNLSWFSIDSGGTTSAGSGYSLSGTIGQADVGLLTGSGYSLQGGFWAAAATTLPTATFSPTPTLPATATATWTPTLPATATATWTPTLPATATATWTRTLTPPPSSTSTPTRAPTATPTPYPRPSVGIVTSTSTPGQLQVTITARDAGCSSNNQLQALHFTRLANATVEVPGVGPIIAPSSTPIVVSGQPASIALTMHRITTGQAATVELVVTDGCGDWPTFFGGGPNAF